MVERVRLSEISAQASAALAAFDAATLEQLAARLKAVARCESEGRPGVEPEPAENVSAAQRVFHDVIAATGRNIEVVQRLQDRKAKLEWAR